MAAINETCSNEGTTVEVGTQTNHFCADFTADLDNSQSSEQADRSYFNFESATITEEISTDNIEVVHMDFHCEDRGNEINDEDIEEYIEEQNAPNIECKECRRMKMQMVKLQRCLQVIHLTEETMERDDKKVKYYTGLPNFATLQLTVQFVSSNITEKNCKKLTVFQQILLVIMKLRLNCDEQDLAYRFGVSQSTISRLFNRWIVIMAQRLSLLIYWPCRDEVTKSMPQTFKKFYGRCICILDCTEIFIERPTDLVARSQTWSNYKHHNTIKVLIGITPQGTVSFLSKAWGGRASDKFITEQCGILEKLIPGDIILADRGFTIEDSVGLYCAQVVVPPFTKGKKQLSRHEVDWSREISHVRIHVERVISLLKAKYTILKGVIPILLLKNNSNDICTIDCMLTVCSALCNMCESVVPFN